MDGPDLKVKHMEELVTMEMIMECVGRRNSLQGQADFIKLLLQKTMSDLDRAKSNGYENQIQIQQGITDLYLEIGKTYNKIIAGDHNCNDASLQNMTCSECQVPFVPKNSKAKFCSTRCRVANHRKV